MCKYLEVNGIINKKISNKFIINKKIIDKKNRKIYLRLKSRLAIILSSSNKIDLKSSTRTRERFENNFR